MDEDPIPKNEFERMMGKRKQATITGCLQELDIVKQQLKNNYKQLERMTMLYVQLRNEFDAFKQQRIIELQGRGHGPTVSE